MQDVSRRRPRPLAPRPRLGPRAPPHAAHGLQQHYVKLKDSEKNRKLKLFNALEFNRAQPRGLRGAAALGPTL